MKAIISLEKLIKSLEIKIKVGKTQLAKHEAKEEILTLMAQASTEAAMEKNTELLKKYNILLVELKKLDNSNDNEKERLRVAIDRKKIYKYNKHKKIKSINLKNKENDEKIEAMLTIDELPQFIKFDDRMLFEIAFKGMEEYLILDEDASKDLTSIKKDFDELLKNLNGDNLNDLGMLNYLIPVIVFYFHILLLNIQNYIEDEELEPFSGFPNFKDWWIEEMWISHQAYFGLYNWKNNISNLCHTKEQKDAWEVIFANWIYVKELLNEKGEVAFEFNEAFDKLLHKYISIEDELNIDTIIKDKFTTENLTRCENFLLLKDNHNIITPYLKFKLDATKEDA